MTSYSSFLEETWHQQAIFWRMIYLVDIFGENKPNNLLWKTTILFIGKA